jgi:hypothetical protein
MEKSLSRGRNAMMFLALRGMRERGERESG